MRKFATKAITADLDKLADFFQEHGKELGIPSRIAMDFAYRCDLLSDTIDKMAGDDSEEDAAEAIQEESEEEAKEEKKEEKKEATMTRDAALKKLDELVAKIAKEEEAEEEEAEAEEEEDEEVKAAEKQARQALARLNRLANRGGRKNNRRTQRKADFPAESIGADKAPSKMEGDEPYMKSFDQADGHELHDKQVGGQLGKSARRNRRPVRNRRNR